jgi:hypothetical protein
VNDRILLQRPAKNARLFALAKFSMRFDRLTGSYSITPSDESSIKWSQHCDIDDELTKSILGISANSSSSPVAIGFRIGIIELHSRTLQFLARAVEFHQKRTLSRAFDALCTSEEITSFERGCDRIVGRAEIEASIRDRKLSAVDQEDADQRKTST